MTGERTVEVESKQGVDEIKRLQGCINDLISIQALAAVWTGQDLAHSVSVLLEVLVRMVRLDFAYARVSDLIGGSPIEAVRLAQRRTADPQPQEVGRALERWLTGETRAPFVIPNPIGEGKIPVTLYRFGLEERTGALVAASRRTDFPTSVETLLLQAAANQVAIGLYEARLLSRQTRAAEELEQRVAERTRQLTAVNEALKKEMVEHREAEEELRRTQAELARVSRVVTVGELTASIAHEVNQPLAAVVTNGNACLRWLAGETPNLDQARAAVDRIVKEGLRASEVVTRIRALLRKAGTDKARLDLNETMEEVVALARGELRNNGIAVRMELAPDLAPVLGDRVQLQQVALNLVVNAIDALSAAPEHTRELAISTRNDKPDRVCVAVEDTGPGLDEQTIDRIFEAFYTTKAQGMGMGLSISRSIIEAHKGRLWARQNDGPGATFQFTLPVYCTTTT